MNILLAFNSNYFMAARVLLHSIMIHNSCELHIYVMYSELREDERTTFSEDAARSGHAVVHYIHVGKEEFSDAPLHCKWITVETYYRLLAQERMPEGMERFLYLDTDMVVLRSLEEFYHMDFEGNLMIACNRKEQGEVPAKHLEQMSLPPDTIYFNAGTLLYNLKEQREKIDPQILHEYPVLFYDRLRFGDQDVLNAVFYRQVKYVDWHIYNMFDYEVNQEETRRILKEQTVIFHFNGRGKPWTEHYWGENSELFWRYAKDFPEYAALYPELVKKQQAYAEEKRKKEAAKEQEKTKKQETYRREK